MTGKRKQIYKKRDYMAFVFLAPWIIGFLVFQAYPFLASAVYSFTDHWVEKLSADFYPGSEFRPVHESDCNLCTGICSVETGVCAVYRHVAEYESKGNRNI